MTFYLTHKRLSQKNISYANKIIDTNNVLRSPLLALCARVLGTVQAAYVERAGGEAYAGIAGNDQPSLYVCLINS